MTINEAILCLKNICAYDENIAKVILGHGGEIIYIYFRNVHINDLKVVISNFAGYSVYYYSVCNCCEMGQVGFLPQSSVNYF